MNQPEAHRQLNPLRKGRFQALFTCILMLLMGRAVKAQKSINDSTISLGMINLTWTGAQPGGDLVNRFGFSSLVGGEIGYKLRSNFYFYTSARLFFGGRVKEAVARNVVDFIGDTINGFQLMALGSDGRYSEVRFFERGFTIPLVAGKVWHVFKKSNPNAGLYTELGAQYFEHKIRIEPIGEDVPQLNREARKGYDRLTSGIGLVQGFGYRHLGNNRLTNFFIGIEVSETFSRSRRSINVDTGIADTAPRLDLLYGIKVGWTFPIYSEAAHRTVVF